MSRCVYSIRKLKEHAQTKNCGVIRFFLNHRIFYNPSNLWNTLLFAHTFIKVSHM